MDWLDIFITSIFGIIAIVGVVVIHIFTQRHKETERRRWQQTEILAREVADEITQKYVGLSFLAKMTAASYDCILLPDDIRCRVLWTLRERGAAMLNDELKLSVE